MNEQPDNVRYFPGMKQQATVRFSLRVHWALGPANGAHLAPGKHGDGGHRREED